MALDLALDRAPGERREGDVAVGLEAVDRLHEGEERHLAQIVVARAPAAEAPGDVRRQAHVPFDQLVAQAPTPSAGELDEERVLARVSGRLARADLVVSVGPGHAVAEALVSVKDVRFSS